MATVPLSVPSVKGLRLSPLTLRRSQTSYSKPLVVKAATVIAPKYTSIKPVGNRVLVKIKSGEDKTTGGLYLPTTAQKKSQEGEVVALGDGATVGGTKVDFSVKEGNQVVYSKYAGTELEFDGTNHLLLKEDDIVGILDSDDIKDLKPLGDRVLIKVAEAEEKTSGGLILTEQAKEKPSVGTIVAVGPGALDEDGKRKPIDISPGSTVMYSKYAGSEFKSADGTDYIALRVSDVPLDPQVTVSPNWTVDVLDVRTVKVSNISLCASERVINGGGAESFLTLGPDSSVMVRYHPDFGPHNDLILLEAPDDAILNDLLHGRVTIRGQHDEDAVLCTPSSTYAMKFVSTSNSVFLIPPGKPNLSDPQPDPLVSVLKLASGNIELVQTAPQLDKLRFLLMQRLYKLDEEDFSSEGLYTWHDLICSIQASDEELREGLRFLSAVEIDGFWQMVHPKSVNMILTMVLTNSVLHDWSLDALVEEEVLSVLDSDGFNSIIVKHCLETFGTKIENDISKLWGLDKKRIAVHFAKQVLGSNGGKMRLEIFVEKWMRNVQKGMSFDLNMLEGEVLYETIGAETWIKAFSVADLPLTPDARFSVLFRERAKWPWKDLEPYVRDLHVPGISSEGLLIKYTRRVQPNADAEPIFSAR